MSLGRLSIARARAAALIALAALLAPLAGCGRSPTATPSVDPKEVAALRAALVGEDAGDSKPAGAGKDAKSADDN